MPSLNDFFNQVVQINTNLQQLDTDLNAKLQQLDTDLNTELQQLDNDVKSTNQALATLIQLQTFGDQVLVHQSQQLDTIICVLENISRNTCALLNEADRQTTLQTSIDQSTTTVVQLYESVHPDAALVFERTEALRKQLLACCPPEPTPPVCTYEPCPAPPPFQREPSGPPIQ